jgi:hypothetical protein
MTMITLICCVLALSSSAFGLPTYGGYSSVSSMRDLPSQQQPFLAQLPTQTPAPVQTGYGQQPSTGYSSGMTSSIQQDTQLPTFIPTQKFIPTQPIISNGYSSYGSQQISRKVPTFADQSIVVPQSYGVSQMSSIPTRVFVSPQQQLFDQQQQLQQLIQQSQIVTEADTMCRGQVAETVIPLEGGRRFIVCLDDSKGFEQHCPKGLVYHTESRRCERKLGPLENPCTSQPCLNGGQCVQTEVSSFQCQCAAGFDGITCELDARVCQTQQPCGQSQDTKCQSFRIGAALQYVCILQNGLAYGLNAQQAQQNPCQGVDGPRPLAISDKGFIMCDGESMFVESCPGGTVWDDLNKACVWPDMQGVVSASFSDQSVTGYSQLPTYGQQRSVISLPTYSSQIQVQRPLLDQTKLISSYGQTSVPSYSSPLPVQRPSLEQTKLTSSYGSVPSYGSQLPIQRPSLDQTLVQSYGSQLPIQRPSLEQTKLTSSWTPSSVPSYGSQLPVQQPLIPQFQVPQQDQTEDFQVPTSTFGSQIQLPQQSTSSYGSQQQIQLPQQQFQLPQPRPQIWQQPIQRDLRPVQQQSSGY